MHVHINNDIDLNEEKESSSVEQDNSFPVEVFPFKIQRFIDTTKLGLNFHPDYTSAAILFAAAVASGNTHAVKVRENWVERTTSYFCLVGRPGANKSHPLSFCLAPIFRRDKDLYNEYKNKFEEFERINLLTKGELEAEGLQKEKPPVLKKHIVSDTTVEALALTHSNNARGLGLYSDELTAWVKNFGRYNAGSDMEFWLSNFSCKPVLIDRKGSASVRIEHPQISVAGTMQPGILQDFAKDRNENGFLDRIIFVYPEEDSKPYWSDHEVDKEIVASYNKVIECLLNEQTLAGKSNEIPFCPEAFEILKKWQRQNTDKANAEDNEYLAAIYAKLEIYCIRLSLILQMLRYACNETPERWIHDKCIESVSVEGAIQAISYFEHTAKKVHHEIYEKTVIDKLSGDKRKIYEILPDVFKTEQMITLAKSAGLSERTAKYFVKDRKFFKKIGHGIYEKLM